MPNVRRFGQDLTPRRDLNLTLGEAAAFGSDKLKCIESAFHVQDANASENQNNSISIDPAREFAERIIGGLSGLIFLAPPRSLLVTDILQ